MNINYFMNQALYEANIALNNNEVPIGGILVHNKTNEVIFRSYNKINQKKNAIYHCELDITLEPCIMCASAISEVHIEKIYFGAYDEKNGGIEKYQLALQRKNAFRPEVYGGIMENKCKELLKNFLRGIR